LINNPIIQIESSQITLIDYLQHYQACHIIDSKPIEDILSALQCIAKHIKTYEIPVTCKNKAWNFVFGNAIGSLNYIKESHILQYKTTLFTLKNGSAIIDGMILIPPQAQSDKALIFCNANATYYESTFYHDYIRIDSYLKHNVSIVGWNYRGYSNSKGSISITNIKKDAEVIVKYLRDQGYVNIGAMGHSIGGDIACHIANKCNLNFLLADRAYGSIRQLISLFTSSKYVAYFLSTCFGYLSNPYIDYCEYKGYKVMTNDPNDEIVDDNASLKSYAAQYTVIKSFAI
jgi:Chlamydia CHLPS protein (DUF818)